MSYGFNAMSGETAAVTKIFKSDNAKSDGDVLTSAKHSAMSPRSPKKVSWISLQRREIYTEDFSE